MANSPTPYTHTLTPPQLHGFTYLLTDTPIDTDTSNVHLGINSTIQSHHTSWPQTPEIEKRHMSYSFFTPAVLGTIRI